MECPRNRHLIFCLAISSSLIGTSAYGQTESASRALEPVIAPEDLQRINQGTAGIREDEQASLVEFSRYVDSTPRRELRTNAYRFLRIRSRIAARQSGDPFRLVDDLISNPDQYCGHPIILTGSVDRLHATDSVTNQFAAQSVQATVVLNDDERTVVMAHVTGIDRLQWESAQRSQSLSARTPVILCGLFFKLSSQFTNGEVHQVPLLVARDLEPLGQAVDRNGLSLVRHRTEGILEDEAGPYYEVLSQACLVDPAAQMAAAVSFREQRINTWFEAEQHRVEQLHAVAEDFRLDNPDDTAGYRSRVRAADSLLKLRTRQFDSYQETPSRFPVFVDMFTHPEEYLGMPVTLHGHVRRCVTYPPDEDPLGLRELHELWLFTDDGQQNPIVVVSTQLPENFPRSAELVDGVSVTGYFFKLYRYSADDADRLAPMLLSGQVNWSPASATAMQVPIWLKQIGVMALLGGFAMLVFYLWHSSRRDIHFRRTVLSNDRSADVPNFDDVMLDGDPPHPPVVPFENVDGRSGETPDPGDPSVARNRAQ